jgi:anti-sigma B factor antagonist
MPEEVVDDGFRIGARRVDHEVVLVEIEGELDIQTVPQAQAFLGQVTATTPRHLVLDLSGLTFLASSGIGLLIAIQSGEEGVHGRMHLLGVTGNVPVERPLTLVGLIDRFDVAPDLSTVLARLGKIEPLAD